MKGEKRIAEAMVREAGRTVREALRSWAGTLRLAGLLVVFMVVIPRGCALIHTWFLGRHA